MEHLLLQRNKFELHEVLCRYFALDTLGKLRRLRQRPDRIVFLPSQDTKIGRFYHPASQLASRLARKWNIPLQSPLRKVSDEKQSGKSFYERFLHAKKAFRFRKKDSSWKGLHILIVDDIFTTGASLNEVARLFRLSGARRVTCLVILNNEGD
ncbi:ComF family protein [Leptospira ryugenii]|uniref:ComF family protein n=1 Tax=Leptospira ryugenii TaxID=1917863 RepID=UPI000D593472|nr:phosphoribosyltransferase family protein [Leptospira ryugenii]